MSREIGGKGRASETSVRSALRTVGRVAIWVTLALLLARGLGAVLAPPSQSAVAPRQAGEDPASAALAIGFARAYLAEPTQRALAPFLSAGAKVDTGRAAAGRSIEVAQAEVSAARSLGEGGEILTVACELRDGRAVYLAVPISRSRAGEAAVNGAPWMVAAPSVAGVAAERPRPLAGPQAPAIRSLAERFLPAYLAARSARELSYLLAPGAAVAPLAGALEPLGSSGSVAQIGEGEGSRRAIVVSGRFRDPTSGAVYPLAYRLEVVRHGRWYVRSVAGGMS